METYTSGQVASLFDITTETVRAWAQEFSEYLSHDANPGNKRNRRFSEDDLGVLALVADMKRIGKTFSDIHAALASGERAEVPTVSMDALEAVGSQNIQLIVQQVQRLQKALQVVQEERDELLNRITELHQYEVDNAILKAERDMEKRRADSAEGRIQELTDQLIGLQQDAGQARGELAAMLRLLKMKGEFRDDEN